MKARLVIGIAISLLAVSSFGEYNVRRPSDDLRPRLLGAKSGQWTLDFDACREKAEIERKPRIVLVDASWWCPYCESLEEKVLTAEAWKAYISERGYYLSMLDMPYRGTVKPDEEWKSKFPALGAGWGFRCWLYDDDYLVENGLTQEDGFAEIVKMYRIENSLAEPGASKVTISSWDAAETITYGRVGYPTIVVFLPDGREAGRFSPDVREMEPAAAQEYVINKIDSIVKYALDADCGLCNDDVQSLYDGSENRTYRGWMEDPAGGLLGTVVAKATKKGQNGLMRYSATVKRKGKYLSFKTVLTNVAENVVFDSKDARLSLTFASHGLRGCYEEHQGESGVVVGAIDCYKCSDIQAHARAEDVEPGLWSFVLKPIDVATRKDRGYGALTVKVSKSGSVRVNGRFGDGKSFSVLSNVIVGETDVYCIPVCIPAYAKKEGGTSFILWFKDKMLFNVTNIGKWKAVGAGGFETSWRPIFSALPGPGKIDSDMELLVQTELDTVKGFEIVEDPSFDEVSAVGRNWRGGEFSSLKAVYTASRNMVSGNMYFKVLDARGREKKVKVGVCGVVCDGVCYGMLKGVDETWAVKISSCNACAD